MFFVVFGHCECFFVNFFDECSVAGGERGIFGVEFVESESVSVGDFVCRGGVVQLCEVFYEESSVQQERFECPGKVHKI